LPLKEGLLIQRIRRAAARRTERPERGIGDDCAVLRIPRDHEALITTDFSLEDIHFRREWHPPESVGHRCLARGLSDIAAMGGVPHAAFLSLALPSDLSQKWVDRFVTGLLKLAARYGIQLAGGDTAQSPDGILADIVVLGSVPEGKAILRSGARPGDLLYVTGKLGSSAAALNDLRDGKKPRPRSHPRHFFPEPRISVGQFLREKKLASAMIDLSDGLSTDLGHICEESKTGAVVNAKALPAVHSKDGLALALHGGEEYELLFAARPEHRIPKQIAGVPVTKIGEIVGGRQMKLITPDGKTQLLKPAGWEHFA
jgi:thiamine-monophosphate kinase